MSKVNKRFYQSKKPENSFRENQKRIQKLLQVHSEAVISLCTDLKPYTMRYSILFQQMGCKSPKINIRQEVDAPILDVENIKIPEGYKILSITSYLPILYVKSPVNDLTEKRPRARIINK